MDELGRLYQALKLVSEQTPPTLDSLLLPLSECLDMISSRDVYSSIDSIPEVLDKDCIALRGDCEKWEIVSSSEDFKEGTGIILRIGGILPRCTEYIVDLHELERRSSEFLDRDSWGNRERIIGEEIQKKSIFGIIRKVIWVSEGEKLIQEGDKISVTSIAKLSIAGIRSVWVQELPKVYLILYGEKDVELYGNIISNLIHKYRAVLVEKIYTQPRYSLLKSAIASTFPDADLLLIAGVPEDERSRYAQEYVNHVDLEFNRMKLNLFMIEGIPSLWLSSNVKECFITCRIVLSALIPALQREEIYYEIVTLESKFEVDGNHKGLIIPVQKNGKSAFLCDPFENTYGYVILPPMHKVEEGDILTIYKIE